MVFLHHEATGLSAQQVCTRVTWAALKEPRAACLAAGGCSALVQGTVASGSHPRTALHHAVCPACKYVGARREQARAGHLTRGSPEARLASVLQHGLRQGVACPCSLLWMQVLSEPGVNRRELRARAKAVRKLGQAFYDVNRAPAQRGSATAVMEELASVMQVGHGCSVAPVAQVLHRQLTVLWCCPTAL